MPRAAPPRTGTNVGTEGTVQISTRLDIIARRWRRGDITAEEVDSLFFEAAIGNDQEAIKFLLDKIDLSRIGLKTGLAPIHLAAGRSNLPLVVALIDSGVLMGPDAQGRMPSIVAIECGADEEVVERLIAAEAELP